MADTSSTKQNHDEIRDLAVRGAAVLRDARFNQGLGFSVDERQSLGILGLLAPRVFTEDEQARKFLINLRQCQNDLDRFRCAMALYDTNRKLFFHVVCNNIKELMPIIYTPVIGAACQNYSVLYETPRGLYITIHDQGHIYEVLSNWPVRDVQAICVTDGERILGLGDLGACGMGIPVGKLALYTAIGGVDPNRTLPICLDVGTNNQKFLADEFYIGLRQARERGPRYQEFLDEFMEACVRRFGHQVLIQFEDFGPDNAFHLLDRYRDKYHMFNDDIQGTAVVAAAGILAAQRITKKPKLSDNTFVFLGAGQASSGIASLLVQEMIESEGITAEQAASHIWLIDSKGLVVRNRPDKRVYRGPLAPFVKDHAPVDTLIEIVTQIKPTVLVGAAAQTGAFDEAVLRKMAELNERPVILALSNPTSQMECTAEQAYKFTDGRAVFASGSPQPNVTLPSGKVMHPGQANNAYVFPAIGLAAIAVKAKHLPDSVFVQTCRALANQVAEADLDNGLIYPPLEQVRQVTTGMAANLAEFMFKHNLATLYPEPTDKLALIRSVQYQTEYGAMTPASHTYPAQSVSHHHNH